MWERRNGEVIMGFGDIRRAHIISRTKRVMKHLNGLPLNRAIKEIKKMEARRS